MTAAGRTQPVWLLAAIVLHVTGQLFRGLAWHEVLSPSFAVERRRVCAWHVCGAGVSGVLSQRGADLVRVGLARRELGSTSCARVAGSLVAEGSFAAASGALLTVLALGIGVGAVAAPSLAPCALAGAGAAVVALLVWRSARVQRFAREVAEGASILRDPRRFAVRVLPWQIGNRVMRMGSIWCFLHAAGLPAGVAVVLTVSTVQGSAASVPLPGANFAAATAALVVAVPLAAGHPVEAGAVAAMAMAIMQPVCLTLVGLAGSLALSCALFRVRTPRALLRVITSLRASSGVREAVA